MRGSAVMHTENNHEGIVAHNSGIIALLPVSRRPAGVPETAYQSGLPPTTVPGLEDTTQDFLTLRYLRRQYRSGSRHKGTNTARPLRNLACRRARQTDVTGQRNMNCVVDQQYRTANSKTAVCSRSLQSREPTVRVERLELEVHRYGRIVPTSNGSYHILDSSTPDSSSEGSVQPLSGNSKVVRAYSSVDDVNVAVNRVDRETNPVTGAADRASGVCRATSDSNIKDDSCVCTVDLDGADVSSQINKTVSRSYSSDCHFKKSTNEYGGWERDPTIYAGSSRSNSSCSDAGLKNVTTDQPFQKDTEKGWEPIYEPITDSDTEPDCLKDTISSTKHMADLVSTKHVNPHCDRSRCSAGRSGHNDLKDIRTYQAEGVNKRRHSAPDDSERNSRMGERNERKHRRWSFNTESDVLQTDRKETAKKLYLNRLLLSKDAKIESWNVFIDIAHDEHTIEEFQFPEPPLSKATVVKEEKEEAATAVPEQNSPGIVHSPRSSSPSSKETMSGDSSCSEFSQELNTEDDTVEASGVFISDPINEAYRSINVLKQSPVPDRENGTHVPRSIQNNSVIISTSGILIKDEEKYTLSSESSETQATEAGVLTKPLILKPKAESNAPGEAVLPDDKSSLYAVTVAHPVEYCPCAAAPCVDCEEENCVQRTSYNSAEALRTHDCFNQEAHYQNTNVAPKNTKDSREVGRNNEPGVRIRISFKECPSGITASDTSKNVKCVNRTSDSFHTETEVVSDAHSMYANTKKSVLLNGTDSNRTSEEWSRLVAKANCSNSETDKDKLSRNFERHPLPALPRVSPQQHVSEEEDSIKRKCAISNNLRSYGEPRNVREEKENEDCSNVSDAEVVIVENNVSGITDKTDTKPVVDTQFESRSGDGVSRRVREYRELNDGKESTSALRKTKRRRRKARLVTSKKQEHDANNEPSVEDSKIHRKQRGPRKPRYSRRSFRHDSIQMFKVSTAFPPQNTHISWRYKCKKPQFLDPVDPKIVNPPSPVMNPGHKQSRLDDGVTNIEIEDDIPSPGSLTIDLGEQNTNASELSNFEEEDRNRKESNIDGSCEEENVVLPIRRRTPSEIDTGTTGTIENAHLGVSPNNDQDQNQIGDMGSESSDEGQNKKKRKKTKKCKAGDAAVTVNVMQNKLTAQMQEKGRRLAQELPGFNWLEEKIRNGGVTTVLPPKRLNGGSVADPPSKSNPSSENARSVVSHVSNSASDDAGSNVLPTPSSPAEHRNNKRLQEYLSKPPKKARGSPTRVLDAGNERQEIVPSLQPTRQHAEARSAPLALTPVPPLQRLQNPQQRSPRQIQPPRTVSEQESSPHQQSPRRPVIVSVSDLAKTSDVNPLLQQLTSCGELEVTLSAPSTSSSTSSDSGVVSVSSHRTSSDTEQPDVTHVNVKPVKAGNRQQYSEERPGYAPPHTSASCKRIGYGAEQLSQPHQPESSTFPPQEHIPVYVWNREPPRWPGEVPARKVQESASGTTDAAYSDRIATMARHAATSFDTGFGMGLGISQETCHRAARHHQHRPSDVAHQPTTYLREHMLRTSGYLPPVVHQPGAYDFRSSQYRMCQPSYMVPQRPVKLQVVRPSAQYPAGMGPCHPSHTCSQTFTAASNIQGFFPGNPQHSNNMINSNSSVFSPHASGRKSDPSMSPTSSAVPSTHSSSVQEAVSELPQTPSSTQNQAQVLGPQIEARACDPENQAKISGTQNQVRAFDHQNKAHVSASENQAVISDTVAKDKDPPKDIEEIRKATEAAVEELEKLEQLKETTKKNLERLKLAEEQAMKELARTQKQLEEAVEVHKVVEPRTAVTAAIAASSESSKPVLHVALPAVAQEIHQPLVQDNQNSVQRPKHTADANGSSVTEFHVTPPAVTQEINRPAAACENHQLGVGCKNHQSDIAQYNLQSGGAHWNKQSSFTPESHQLGAICRGRQSSDARQNRQSEAACENRPFEAVCKNQQSTLAGENCQSGAACKNQQSAVTHEINQSENEGQNDSAVAVGRHSGVTSKNLPLQQKSSVTSDTNITSIQGLSATFPAVVQANQQLESTHGNCETQQKQSVPSDSTGSSVALRNTTLETVMWEKQPSRIANENSKAQQVPSCSSGSTDSSISQLHLKIPMDTNENNLSQQKLIVSSNSTGSSLTNLNSTFPAVLQENHQSDSVRRNHETQQKLNVAPDNTRSSISTLTATLPATVPVNVKSGVVCDSQQPGSACSSHTTRHELSATSDNRRTGSSGPGLNLTFPALPQENWQSGFAHRNQQQGDACEQYHSTVPCASCQSVKRTSSTVGVTRSSMSGLRMACPTIPREKYQSEQKLNVSVSSMTRHSAPALLTTCPTTRYQNQEAVPRPLPPSPVLVRPPPPVPVSHQMTLSQSQTAPHLKTHSVLLQPHPVKGVHPPLPPPSHSKFSSVSRPSVHTQLLHMPQPPLYPYLSPVSQTTLKSQISSVSQKSPHCQLSPISLESPHSQSAVISQTSPHFHSLSKSQTASQYESSLSQLSPRSQSLITTQKFPHTQALSLPRTSPNSQSLPSSQMSPHSQSFPLPQTSPHVHSSLVSPTSPHAPVLQISHTSAHSHLSPVSQASPQSQSLPFFQTSPHSQPGLASQPPVRRQTLQVPQHSPSKTHPLQVPTDQLRSPTNLMHSSVQMLAVRSKIMPPPSRRQNVLPKPPESLGSQIPVPILSKCTSPQAAPDPVTAHSVESSSDVSVITQFRSTQQSSIKAQEPHIVITSTSNRLHSSTVEEYPIDLSIGKQKSETISSRHHQGGSQIQPSVVHNPSLEEQNIMDNSGVVCHNHRMSNSHTSQLKSAKNSEHQQQLQTTMQTGSKGKEPLAASLSTADNCTGKDGLGRRHESHRTSVPEYSSRQKCFEALHNQNVDGGSVLHRKHVNAPMHLDIAHHSQQDVHQYHTLRPTPSSSCVPAYHKTVVHGLQSEQQQRNHTAQIHTANAVSSRRDTYWSANKQVSSAAAIAPDLPSQDTHSVTAEHSLSHSRLLCGRCNQTARFMCSACHNEWYCSAECQLQHWSYHAGDCSRQHQNEDQ